MTRDYFLKRHWKGYEIINYGPKRKDGIKIECLLLAVDFENELFQLEPIDKEIYEDKQFWARVEYCERPNLRIIKSKK